MGICVRCRSRFCSECVTKLDGVNHCVGCLAELASGETQGAALEELGHGASRVRAGLYFTLLSGLAWLLLEAAFSGSS